MAKRSARLGWPKGRSPWWPEWDGSTRVLYGPRLGEHPSPTEVILRVPAVPPRGPGKRTPAPGWGNEVIRDRDIDSIERRIVDELYESSARRTPQKELADQSREIARDLFVWRARWARWRRGEIPAMAHGWFLCESNVAATIVTGIEEKERRKIPNHDGRLLLAITHQRMQVDNAEENFHRAKKRPGSSFNTLCKWSFRIYAEKQKRAVLIRELRERRMSGHDKASGKRALPREYALAPLLIKLFRRGIPDKTTARLLRLVALPVLTPRQIKRIRSRC